MWPGRGQGKEGKKEGPGSKDGSRLEQAEDDFGAYLQEITDLDLRSCPATARPSQGPGPDRARTRVPRLLKLRVRPGKDRPRV